MSYSGLAQHTNPALLVAGHLRLPPILFEHCHWTYKLCWHYLSFELRSRVSFSWIFFACFLLVYFGICSIDSVIWDLTFAMLCLRVSWWRNVKNVDDCGSWMRSATTAGMMDCEQRLLRTLHADWLMHIVWWTVDWTAASRPSDPRRCRFAGGGVPASIARFPRSSFGKLC
jgi:hypothetical protein